MNVGNITELCRKVFIINTDLLDILNGMNDGENNYTPILLAFLALVVLNVRFWDRFTFPDNFVEPPFHMFLPCIEAAGHWILSNMSMTLVLYLYSLMHNTKTIQVPSWYEKFIGNSRLKQGVAQNHYFINSTFLLLLSISVILLIVSVIKKWKTAKSKNNDNETDSNTETQI